MAGNNIEELKMANEKIIILYLFNLNTNHNIYMTYVTI